MTGYSGPAGGSPRPPVQLRALQQRSQPRFQYLLSLPPEYHTAGPDRRWPLILFLHGAGEGAPGGLERLKTHGVPRLVTAHGGEDTARAGCKAAETANLECAAIVAESAIIVSPQLDYLRHGYGWRPEALLRLLDELYGDVDEQDEQALDEQDGQSAAEAEQRLHRPQTAPGRPGSKLLQPHSSARSLPDHLLQADGTSARVRRETDPQVRGSSSTGGYTRNVLPDRCGFGSAGAAGTGRGRSSSSTSGYSVAGSGGTGSRSSSSGANLSSSGDRNSCSDSGLSGRGGAGMVWEAVEVEGHGDVNSNSSKVWLPLRIDPDRVYVTGVSMGGYGTWALGAAASRRFAALVPLGGGGDPTLITPAALGSLPVWAFHGDRDEVIPVSASLELVQSLQAGGCSVRFTRYERLGHESWARAYNTPQLWRWVLDQNRRDRKNDHAGGQAAASPGSAPAVGRGQESGNAATGVDAGAPSGGGSSGSRGLPSQGQQPRLSSSPARSTRSRKGSGNGGAGVGGSVLNASPAATTSSRRLAAVPKV